MDDKETETDSEAVIRLKKHTLSDAQTAVEAFGFHLTRVSGSHHIQTHPDVPELINLQNVKGKTMPYQIKQFFEIVERYNLQLEEKS